MMVFRALASIGLAVLMAPVIIVVATVSMVIFTIAFADARAQKCEQIWHAPGNHNCSDAFWMMGLCGAASLASIWALVRLWRG